MVTDTSAVPDVSTVTEVDSVDTPGVAARIGEAIGLVDGGLTSVQHRELVSADEVANLLLDLRSLLTPLSELDFDGDVPVAAADVPVAAN